MSQIAPTKSSNNSVVDPEEGSSPSAAPKTSATTLPKGYDEHFMDSVLDKQGGRCFGCCWDYKRATILVNIVIILVNGALLGVYVSNLTRKWAYPDPDLNDDETIKEFEYSQYGGAIMAGISMAFAIVAWVGAVKYNRCLIILNIIWLVIVYVARVVLSVLAYEGVVEVDDYNISTNDTYEGDDDYTMTRGGLIATLIFAGVITGIVIYPHATLAKEIKLGIMTPKTYNHREKRACIC